MFLQTITTDFSSVEIDSKQIYRFLKLKEVDNEISSLIENSILELKDIIAYKAVYTQVSVKITNQEIDLQFTKFQSQDLAKNLSNCSKAIIFAATIGPQIERQIIKYSEIDQLKSLIYDTIGSVAVDCFCDKINQEFALKQTLKPRFSPGYGDLNLSIQKDILKLLDSSRKVGITLNDKFIMSPKKSVTAFIGIQTEKGNQK